MRQVDCRRKSRRKLLGASTVVQTRENSLDLGYLDVMPGISVYTKLHSLLTLQRPLPSTQLSWHTGGLVGNFQSIDCVSPKSSPFPFLLLLLFLFHPISQVPICPSPDSAFTRSCCFHSILCSLVTPLPTKVSWTRYKRDNYFLSYPRSTQELSFSQSTNRSLGVIMILTIQLEHILHVKDAVSSHSFQPVLPAAAREIFQEENVIMISLALILSLAPLSFSLSVMTPEYISHHSPHCFLRLHPQWPSFRSSNQMCLLFCSLSPKPFDLPLPTVDTYSLDLCPNFLP